MIEFFFELWRKATEVLRQHPGRKKARVQPRRFDREIDLDELDRRFDYEKSRIDEISRKLPGEKK